MRNRAVPLEQKVRRVIQFPCPPPVLSKREKSSAEHDDLNEIFAPLGTLRSAGRCLAAETFQQRDMLMKMLLAVATFALVAGPALAQSPQSSSTQQSPQNQQSAQSSQHGLVAAQKIQQDLQKEGFTDVKVVAESFVVQGKSPDGDPVVMTIGPHGMSVFEAMNAGGSSSGTTGSNSSPSRNSGSNPVSPGSSGMRK